MDNRISTLWSRRSIEARSKAVFLAFRSALFSLSERGNVPPLPVPKKEALERASKTSGKFCQGCGSKYGSQKVDTVSQRRTINSKSSQWFVSKPSAERKHAIEKHWPPKLTE